MKCLDCVSVCPKAALRYGFGRPSIAAWFASLGTGAGRAAREARTAGTIVPSRPGFVALRAKRDLSWPEELAVAAVFLLALPAFRGLYHRVPLLLAIGLAVCVSLAVAVVWRLARHRDVTLQHHVLRRDGAWTRTGVVVTCLGALAIAATAHGAFVQHHVHRGTRLLEDAERATGPERAAAVDASLAHLDAADRWGLLEDGVLQNMLGAIHRERGDVDEAMRRFRRAFAAQPRLTAARLALADLLKGAGRDAEAIAELEAILRIDPHHDGARRRLEAVSPAER